MACLVYWGRRKEPGSTSFPTLNEHECTTFVWDPATHTNKTSSNQPTLVDGTKVNLFCSGHTFLEDGRLMVIGGHLFDSQGVNEACVYDPATDRWTAVKIMNDGRWYRTAVTLPDGSALACAGTFATGPLQPPSNDSSRRTGKRGQGAQCNDSGREVWVFSVCSPSAVMTKPRSI